MVLRPRHVRNGALHAVLLVALAACGSTDPPTPLLLRDEGTELRLPKSLSVTIDPEGHSLWFDEAFGLSVAVSGARVAVADYLGWGPPDLGLAHVDLFDLVGGEAVRTARVPAVGFAEWACFGEALALDGELLAVGEPCAAGGAGQVHVYAWDGAAWGEEPALVPPAAAGGARFGTSLGMAANRMVVGAPFEQAAAPDGAVWGVGAAYVYVRSGGAWRLEARLTASDGGMGDTFGMRLSMDAARIAVASPGRWNGDASGVSPLGPNGKVYVFELQGSSTWREVAALTFAGGRSGEWIGRTLTLCSGAIFAGSDLRLWPAVHALQLGPRGWVEGDLDDAALPASCFVDDPLQPNNCRVDALACDGATLVVGMPFANGWAGTARVYEKLGGAWAQRGEVAGVGPTDRAGHAVAVDGSVVAVGVPSATVIDGSTPPLPGQPPATVTAGRVRVQRF